MKKFGFNDTINWYNQNSKSYFEKTSDKYDLDQIEEFCSLLPSQGVILDAGCAAGRDCQIFKNKNFQVTGIDISKGLLKIAKKNNPGIKFSQEDYRATSFKNSYFDGVWAHMSLVHLETQNDVEKSIKEFNRILKPNGILLILVKAKKHTETEVIKDDFSNHIRFFRYYTKDELKLLLENQGFKVLKLEQYREISKHKDGRKDIELILVIGKKL